MKLKVLLLVVYHHLQLMTIIPAAPTFRSDFNNTTHTEISFRKKFMPRILNYSNTTSRGHLFGGFIEESGTLMDSREIIFPDTFKLLSRLNSEVPECPTKDVQFCENFDAYPQNHLRNILEKTRKHGEFFGTDEAPIELANRLAEPEEMFICPSSVKTIFPQAGKNKDDKWRFIINQRDEEGVHVQGIRIETCTKLNEPCNLLNNAPFGYVTSCKQKFVYRRLLSVAENGQPTPDTFQIPSACCCSFKRDISLLTDSSRSDVSSTKRRRRK